MAGRTILLTGITGSVGSWMARTILRDGCRVIALVRAKTEAAARTRAQRALDVVGAGELIDNTEVLRGDIRLDGLGLPGSVRRSCDISLIVHCAGLLEFADRHAQCCRRINVTGTANVLGLARALGVPVCHFSTAYIAGKRTGVVYEHEIDVGQQFNNPYESSKCRAELLIKQWTEDTGLDAFVLRPTIVIGDSEQGRIMNFDGLYNLLRIFDSIADKAKAQEFRIPANRSATKNFVPVDYLGQAAWHIITQGRPGTYHLSNPSPTGLSELESILQEVFGVPQARGVPPDDFQQNQPNDLEWIYQRAVLYYQPYMMDEPIFDRTNADLALAGSDLTLPEIDVDFIARLLHHARTANWGRRRR